MSYDDFFKNKKITLMGLGLLGRGVGDARFLAQAGAELLVTDLKTAEQLKDSLEQLKDFPNITYRLGRHIEEDFEGRDMIIKAAGVPLDSPYIAHAHKNKVPVRMSADLFVELSGVPVVGVTGTRGKSTTTHLLVHILRGAGMNILLGGNVQGISNLDLLTKVKGDSIAVLELDSWQLQGFGEAKISPQVAVFTTFYPDHMNYYHGDMKLYFADKANIFLNQNEDDYFIVGEQVVPILKEYGFESRVRAHTTVVKKDTMPKSWTLRVPGDHNRYDAAVAVAAARALSVDDDAIKAGVESFKGVPGRLELIREVRGVKIYNDTTATTPEATAAGLAALDPEGKQNILLILGGADKGLEMDSILQPAVHAHVKEVFLLAGSGTERIKSKVTGNSIYETLDEAVQKAFQSAQQGDIILFSPAFASFGMFKNEFDRGEQFNEIVAKLS
jgi:UDP-N-acetylmuramoylalanine--D-glutamate ligase